MNRYNIPKKQAQRIHAKKRIKQRLGIEINRHEYKELVERIVNGKYKKAKKQSRRVTLFEMIIKDIKSVVVYDNERHNIVIAWRCDENTVFS